MNLLSRLFRKPPSPPLTLEQRIAAVGTGTPESIRATAVGGGDESIRTAAIRLLSDGDDLRGLAVGGTPGSIARAAQARLAELLDAGTIDFDDFTAQLGSRPVLLSIAAMSRDPARLAHAFSTVDDPREVARMVIEGPSSRLRQLAAVQVDDPVQLRQLLKQVREKDKNVYKILKTKCDALTARERQAAEIAAEVEALCSVLERHSRKPYDGQFAATLEYHVKRWRAQTAQPTAELESRAAAAIETGREVVAAHLQQVERQAAQLAALQAAREADDHALQTARREAQLLHEADEQARKQAAAQREDEAQLRTEQRAAEDQILRKIGGLIRSANGALNDGHTQRAAGLRRAIDEKLTSAPVPPAYITRQVQQLDEKLSELKQWKDYAVAPKRQELIEEMESLIGSVEEPKVLADRIKGLQEDWRTMSKGIVGDTPDEWERFQSASQAAYEPCRMYFQAQAQLRRENLDARRMVMERLAAFEAGQTQENLDWRLLAGVLREAPQEWRQYFPVDREPGRASQADFDACMTRLQTMLDAWYERNAAAKHALVARARQFVTLEDSRAAIDAVKQLQGEWKNTGVARRDQDQALWSEFRESCDAIFQKRQQAFAEYSAALDANKSKAIAICEAAEELAGLSDAALSEGAANVSGWRTAFDALDEMPRADARGLKDRFERALEACGARVAEQRRRDAERSFGHLFEAARLVQGYGWSVISNAESTEQDTLKRVAEDFIAWVEHWPKGALPVVKHALATAEAGASADAALNEKALRALCIRCEIQSATPTPAEDEALRRELQVQRLVRGMGQGLAEDNNWDALALEWTGSSAVSPAVYGSLQPRFLRCWAQRPQRGPRQP